MDEHYNESFISSISSAIALRDDRKLPREDKRETANKNDSENKDKLCVLQTSYLSALLPIVKLNLQVESRTLGNVYALLDTGAQMSLITSELVERFKIPTTALKKSLIGINGDPFQTKGKVIAHLSPWFISNEFIDAELLVLPTNHGWNVTSIPYKIDLPSDSCTIRLANPDHNERVNIHMILGVTEIVKCLRAVASPDLSNMGMLNTIFGNVIYGQCPGKRLIPSLEMTANFIQEDELSKAVSKLWQIDQVPEAPKQSKQERLAENIFINEHRRASDGRFIVVIPLKQDITSIGDSRKIALQRFFAFERRLRYDDELKEKYVDFMRTYEKLGHMRVVDSSANPDELIYYIPHHCINKDKFRVVFDGSCKTDQGISLNDIQLIGEKLQFDLADTIMRFRRHPIVMTADIKMMFRQVRVSRKCWNLQRIFWRENTNSPLKEYWLTVVTYGLASSAHNAVRALVQCGRDKESEFPTAARAILKDFYMDDFLSGANCEGEAKYLAQQVDRLLTEVGFELRKWQSNSVIVRTAMKTAHDEPIIISEEDTTTILGLKWHPSKDTFSFAIKIAVTEELTKRDVLGKIAQLYDPLGYITPVTIVGRIIMQEIWKKRIEWDQKLPDDILKMWSAFWKDIRQLEKFNIPRWLGTAINLDIHLHGFADASSKAYGAVIYVQVGNKKNSYTTNLLLSKSRVTPLKTVSIPRLELTAMELLARLMRRTRETMEWTAIPYTLWSDSTIALHWINKEPYQCETFVANRVASIQINSDYRIWRHAPTAEKE